MIRRAKNKTAPAPADNPEPTLIEAEASATDSPAETTSSASAEVTSSAPPPPPVAEDHRTQTQPEPNDDYSVTRYLDLGDLFTTPRNPNAEERERTAAADFQAAIAPAFAGMEGSPPSASTPDEAVREFVEATGDARPDPGSDLDGNIYVNEATAYYRIRKHFLKGVGRPQGGWQPPPGLGPPT